MVSELKQRQNLVRRGDTYSVRLMIPKDIQPLYGTAREKIKALGTSDRAEAEARKHAVLAAFHEEFQAHRRRREPTADDVAKAAEEVYRLALADDMDRRDTALSESAYEDERHRLYRELTDEAELEEALENLKTRRASNGRAGRWRDGWETALRQHVTAGESVLVADIADHIFQRDGLSIPKGSIPYTRFCRELIKAQLRAIEKMKERDQEIFEDDHSTLTVIPHPSVETRRASPTIADRLDLYVAENPNKVSPGVLAQNRWVTEMFAQFVEGPGNVSQITRTNVAEWRRALRSWPECQRRRQNASLLRRTDAFCLRR